MKPMKGMARGISWCTVMRFCGRKIAVRAIPNIIRITMGTVVGAPKKGTSARMGSNRAIVRKKTARTVRG
jgi:hypothetical protein